MGEYNLKNTPVWGMLSAYGRRVDFLTHGVLGQTAEARADAYRFNATLGEAREKGGPMYLTSMHRQFSGVSPQEVYPYAHPAGLPRLCALWEEKALRENPAMADKKTGTPVVTAGLTHGLSLVGSLFLDPGDPVLLHDKHWENYDLIFGDCCCGEVRQYPTFSEGHFNWKGLQQLLEGCGEKALVVLNFPNNPTGYMPDREEALQIAAVLRAAAEAGKKLTVLCDDAYYGFWYADGILRESLFGILTGLHPNVLTIRLDGATKEYFAGGLRLGFLTFGGQPEEVLEDLRRKTTGAIRISVSSAGRFSQQMLCDALESEEVSKELQQKKEILEARGKAAIALCQQGSGKGLWTAYPFRAGYFICLRVEADAERLRRHLLQDYGIGVIALNDRDIRIALPCLETEELTFLMSCLDQAIDEVR